MLTPLTAFMVILRDTATKTRRRGCRKVYKCRRDERKGVHKHMQTAAVDCIRFLVARSHHSFFGNFLSMRSCLTRMPYSAMTSVFKTPFFISFSLTTLSACRTFKQNRSSTTSFAPVTEISGKKHGNRDSKAKAPLQIH